MKYRILALATALAITLSLIVLPATPAYAAPRINLDPEEGDVLWRQDRFFADLIEAL